MWCYNRFDQHPVSTGLIDLTYILVSTWILSFSEGRRLARSCEVKFIETSACIQHNVDELLVGILKQMRLRQERRESGEKGKNTGSRNSRSSSTQARRISSPLHTLQVARDILARVCISSKSSSKSCENLHVL